jgi:hypothetical protein
MSNRDQKLKKPETFIFLPKEMNEKQLFIAPFLCCDKPFIPIAANCSTKKETL